MFAVHICCALFKRLVTTNEGVVFRFFPLILCLIVLQPFIKKTPSIKESLVLMSGLFSADYKVFNNK